MAGYETIIYEKKGHIAYITLNRPHVLNIYNICMRDELFEVLGAIKWDTEVHAVILSGAGEKAFCAGADLSEFLSAPSPAGARHVRWRRDVWGLFLSLPQPVIAALHGYVFGSGIEMAMSCDMKIASEDAVFGLPEVALGIIPAAGATQTVPRAIGPGPALDMFLTGRRIQAAEALEMKLVNRVVQRSDLLPQAEALAEKIVNLDQRAVRALKQAVSRGLDLPLNEGLKLESRLSHLIT
ncbi:MAG: enoyl-CoA hydratase/isomerase family protein [Chloroflexi bacterium]|nr:enoyl-CoA hydratase/isomerase family protein [Chloroflexota bacterium]